VIRDFVARKKLDLSATTTSLLTYLIALGPILFLLVHLNDTLIANTQKASRCRGGQPPGLFALPINGPVWDGGDLLPRNEPLTGCSRTVFSNMRWSASYVRIRKQLDQALSADRRETFIVIMGLAKSGTTLPLTLLDSHPELLVLPEELRFFHCAADVGRGLPAAERLLSDVNMKQYRLGRRNYTTYEESMGTGTGRRDYSNVDYEMFSALLRHCFANSPVPRQRYRGVFYSYALAQGKDPLRYTNFVSKAPHNEIYCRQWMAMLEETGKYIYVHRDPAELFLSLRRVASMGGQAELSLDAFIRRYRLRAMLFDLIPSGQRLPLAYEQLVSDTEAVMADVCDFAGIPSVSQVLVPTKNGLPWSGNSSYGIQSERVFSNPKVAQRDLAPETLAEIGSRLCDVLSDLGHPAPPDTTPKGKAVRALDRWFCTLEARLLLSRIELVRSSPIWYRTLKGLRARWHPSS